MSWYETSQRIELNQENLNGAWDFCAWEDDIPPQVPLQLPWQSGAYQVKAYPGASGQPSAGLLRRWLRFEARKGQRAWLRFERCGGAVVFYLNGRRFYASPERWLPVELDIQDHTVPGENELVIWRGAGDEPLQGAHLVYLPAVSIPDLAVRPRKGELDLEVTLENRTWERFEGRLELHLLEPVRPGQLVVQETAPLAVQLFALERGLLTTLALRPRWEGGRTWSLLQPWLYEVEARLVSERGLLDARRVRFGLREVYPLPGGWRLNGAPLEARRTSLSEIPDFSAAPAALRALRALKEGGTTVLRLDSPYPAFVLDAADQVGLLVESHSADWGEGGLPPDPAFRDASQDHLRRLARRDRTHPSLAGWYLDGEIQDAGRLVAALRGMDPTRPIFMGQDISTP